MSKNVPAWRSIAIKITLIFLPVLIFLVIAEFSLRYYFKSHIFYDVEMARYANILKMESSNPLIGHVHRPGKDARLMGVDVSINSDGLRDDEYTLERNDKQRFILLGDSLTFGWGVEKEQSFEQLLEDKFNAIEPTELINFGAGNYNTTQELNLFLEKGLRYHPDAVFLFYFINDAEPTPAKSRYAWLANFRVATFFWSRVKALIAKRSPPKSFKDYYSDLYVEGRPGWELTRSALVELKNICDQNGIVLKVVILPELHNLVDYTFKDEHRILTEHLTLNGIDHIDLAPYFTDWTSPIDLWVARDDAHPNAIAHNLITGYSFPFLSDLRPDHELN